MSATQPQRALIVSLGAIPYAEALALQEHYHQQVVQGVWDACLIFLEHPPVLTLGKHSRPELVLISEEDRKNEGIDYVVTDRGGEVTAHMPGQLVVYPIVAVGRLGVLPKAFVNRLEQCVLNTLQDFGIEGHTDAEHPGVWVGGDKVCAVGVRIREKVSMHGIALNCDNSLGLFGRIVPCGISDKGVTSVSSLLGRKVERSELEPLLLKHFREFFPMEWSLEESAFARQ